MSGGRPWMTSEVRILHKMREQRFAYRQIAAALGRTEYAIIEMLRYVPATRDKPAGKRHVQRRAPLPKPPKQPSDVFWTEQEIATIRRLARQRATAREAAEAIGRSYHAVRSKAGKIGVRFRGRRGAPPKNRTEQEGKRLNRNAVQGSAQLLEALMRVAA